MKDPRSQRNTAATANAGRVQVAISADDTEIVGRVRGDGPPLVLVHGGWGDGEVAYESLVPYLTDRFTCYTPSTRGRGLSGDSSDHSVQRLAEDVAAFIDSIGEPAYVLGWSGVDFTLGAVRQSANVAAVTLFEGGVLLTASEADLGSFGGTVEQTGAAATDGRLDDAARGFAPLVMSDDELAAASDDFYEQWGQSVPAMLQYFQQNVASEAAKPDAPEQLARVSVPLLALWGQRTRMRDWFARSAEHYAHHVPNGRVRDIPGIGHFAPVVAPKVLAEELISEFEPTR